MTDSTRQIQVERDKFDELLMKLLAVPAVSAARVSEQIKFRPRSRPLTQNLLNPEKDPQKI